MFGGPPTTWPPRDILQITLIPPLGWLGQKNMTPLSQTCLDSNPRKKNPLQTSWRRL